MNFASTLQESVFKVADDFGVDNMHDEIMLALLKEQKIDGVSVFSEFVSPTSIHSLIEVRSKFNIQIGLHFNLTHGSLLPDVSSLLVKSIFSTVDKKFIYKALKVQLQAFEEKFGFMPDFIDGHQHVHAFPVIAKVVIEYLVRIQFKGWVRNVGAGSIVGWRLAFKCNYLKKFLILEVLSFFHKKKLKKSGIFFNNFFFGLMPLDKPKKLHKALLHLHSINFLNSTVIMCHPGSVDGSGTEDHPAKSRELEASWLLEN